VEVALKVESLHRCKKPYWDGSSIVRIARRKKIGTGYWMNFSYFVSRPGDPVGHGVWVGSKDLVPLSCLELLALEAEEVSETDEEATSDLGKN